MNRQSSRRSTSPSDRHAPVLALAKAGFEQAGQRGSHVKLRSPDGRVVIVPDHREIARGTMRSILRQAGVTVEEFEGLA